MNPSFPIVAQIHDAADDRARASILLRCPDTVFSACAAELADACRICGFKNGATFIELRFGAFDAVRDADGQLPAWYREARAAFASYANRRAEGDGRAMHAELVGDAHG